MFYLVYKIIQLSTGREYIGQHQTSNLNDGYMGSGTLIAPAVEENPADFIKTILWYCDSADEMNELEAALVTEEYLLANFPEKTFNQVPGGKISMDVVSKWSRKLNPERSLRGSMQKTSVKLICPVTGKTYSMHRLSRTPITDYPELLQKYEEICSEYGITGKHYAPRMIMCIVEEYLKGVDFHKVKELDTPVGNCRHFLKTINPTVTNKQYPWYHVARTTNNEKALYFGRIKGLEGDIALFHEFSGLNKLEVAEMDLSEWKILRSMWNN